MKEPSTAADLLRQIEGSAGSGYLNRIHQRSFSLNVFRMNAVELMEAAHRVKDPDQGMALMMEKNGEAGRQAHRELNRHVHNFVSSALTLVEHTRVFMRKHYVGTDLMEAYEKQVAATFAQSSVAQFVQGLRNYMLHKGLPKSSMFMKFTSNPDATDGSGTAETGVHYDTASLLDWDGWKPVARTYLEQVGEHLDLHESAQEYLALVNQFHGWLDATLAAYHQSDLHELGQLQIQFHAISPTRQLLSATTIEPSDDGIIESFEFTSMQVTELSQISSNLLGKIRELHFQQRPQGFPTERPTATITDQELLGPIKFWGQEVSGEDAFMFIHHEGKAYGLSENDYCGLDGLIDAVLKSAWARASLSGEFIETTFCDWARQRFGADGPPFSEALSAAARESVTVAEVWAPIANMEVEQGFDFGPVRIESITATVMENLRSRVPSNRPEQDQQVSQLFDKLRHEMQGYAAVVVSIEAEPETVQKRALRIAQDAVGLLRFFSPAAPRSYLFSPVALAGAEFIPTSKLIVMREGGFLHDQSILPKQVGYWRLPAQQISELKAGLLDTAASLVMPEGLSEFALAVRASLLTFSKGTTLVDPLDRLRNSLSALEGVLLKHEMEPRAHSVANRMSFLLAREGDDRESVQQVIRQIYWLQGQPQMTAHGRREDELITVFTSYAYDILRLALEHTRIFCSKVQFVIGVDKLGLSTQ
ncbi:MAG: hypothetical protein FD131_2537 [Rhodocyclaceae bacterium]|nr:MAG: hypothetical protein FD131_2537 [Rhodocyclaceae bacterium]